MRILAAIVARAQSPALPQNLLPKRPLTKIHGREVLAWIADRIKTASSPDRIVVAVGHEEQDAEIITLARQLELEIHIGHPDDVLARLHLAAEAEGAEHVIRVNGNFPLVDPDGLDELVAAHLEHQADFSLNSHYHGMVYGLGVEVISFSALKRLIARTGTRDREKLGSLYFHQDPDEYKIHFQPSRHTAPHLRVSVDFEPDIRVVSEIMEQAPALDNKNIIDFLSGRPDLLAWQEIITPAEVSLEKALLFPEKIKALRLNNSVTRDTTYPISVELSLTNRCNHKCIWCSDSELRTRLPGELSLPILSRLFSDLKQGGARGVVIEGGGEPTISPHFEEAVNQARRADLALGLITNGYLMPFLGYADEFEWIRISLDAATRDQYKALKGVDGFNRVINNLMALAANRRQTTLGVGYVLTNQNDDLVKLEQLVLFLRKIGVNYLQFRPVVDHPELFSEAGLEFLKKYEAENFSVNITAMNHNLELGNSGLPCLAHSLSTVIAADGSVFLCGRLNRFDTWQPVGNLNCFSFQEIWTGLERRRQVRLVSKAEFCRTNCPQCRMTKYNRLLNDVERVKTRNFI